ncbi:MAG: methyltransferase regulatory domain-containing protein [bacterium]
MDLIRPLSDRYLFHEHLADHNHAVWFTDFVARAGEHGLQYLGDGELHGMIPERYGPETAAWVRRGQPDQVTRRRASTSWDCGSSGARCCATPRPASIAASAPTSWRATGSPRCSPQRR